MRGCRYERSTNRENARNEIRDITMQLRASTSKLHHTCLITFESRMCRVTRNNNITMTLSGNQYRSENPGMIHTRAVFDKRESFEYRIISFGRNLKYFFISTSWKDFWRTGLDSECRKSKCYSLPPSGNFQKGDRCCVTVPLW